MPASVIEESARRLPDSLEREFRASLDAVLPWRTRLAALTALGGSGAFTIVDLLALNGDPLHFRVIVRAAFTPAFALLASLAMTRPSRARPHLAVLAMAIVLSFEMGTLGSRLPPAESVGFFPAVLFFTVFLPLPRARAMLMGLTFVLGFLVPQLLFGGGPAGPIIKHTGNLIAAGVISLVASHMAEALARREFVAQRRLAETSARLEALARAKDRFFARVSNELRTPLTAALLALETSRLGKDEHAPVARPLKRMQKLVDELLALSRVDTGPAQGVSTDLAATALRMGQEFQGAFAFRGLSLELSIGAEPLPARIGAESFGRILASLLGRALETLPRKSTLALSVARDGAHVRVQLIDDGPALPSELPSDDAGADEEGPGIALAVARGLAELHQGQLASLSGPAGTAYTLRFPLARVEPSLQTQNPRLAEQVEGAVAAALDGTEVLGKPPRTEGPDTLPLALVLEDHLDLAARLTATLADLARVERLDSAEGAIDLIRVRQPDLVIAEAVLQTGASAGLLLARALREDPSTRVIPLLLLSALTDREHVLAALQAGADDVLAKPFDGGMLRARVEGLLRLKKKRDEAQQAQSLLRTLFDGFAQALRWDSIVLLTQADGQPPLALSHGGLEPPEGDWSDTAALLTGPARTLTLEARPAELIPRALTRHAAVAVAPLDSSEDAGAQEQGALLGFSRAPRPID
ncbi:MAG: response regulator, partial [Deltaproteobacteria bacterium]|nr:response regulator [Deltaproteobacteria bacterium]